MNGFHIAHLQLGNDKIPFCLIHERKEEDDVFCSCTLFKAMPLTYSTVLNGLPLLIYLPPVSLMYMVSNHLKQFSLIFPFSSSYLQITSYVLISNSITSSNFTLPSNHAHLGPRNFSFYSLLIVVAKPWLLVSI